MTMTRKAISAAISTNGIESRTRVMTAFISPHGGLQRCVSGTGPEADRPALMPTPARGRADGVVGVGACGTVSRPVRAAQSVRSVCELPNGFQARAGKAGPCGVNGWRSRGALYFLALVGAPEPVAAVLFL